MLILAAGKHISMILKSRAKKLNSLHYADHILYFLFSVKNCGQRQTEDLVMETRNMLSWVCRNQVCFNQVFHSNERYNKVQRKSITVLFEAKTSILSDSQQAWMNGLHADGICGLYQKERKTRVFRNCALRAVWDPMVATQIANSQ